MRRGPSGEFSAQHVNEIVFIYRRGKKLTMEEQVHIALTFDNSACIMWALCFANH